MVVPSETLHPQLSLDCLAMRHHYARTARTLAALFLSAALLNACAGGDAPTTPKTSPPGTDPTTPPVPTPVGAMVVTITGLVAGTLGDVVISGPSAYARNMSATGLIESLVPGRYTVSGRAVRTSDGRFAPSIAEQSVDVAAGGSAALAAVTYVALPTVVDVVITGLPNNVAAAVTLSPPIGADVEVGASMRVAPAQSGRWRMSASFVRDAGYSYAPSPSARDTIVTQGDTLRFAVQYALSSGAMALAITGLPTAATPNIVVSGPNAFTQTIHATTTLTDLAPGTYVVSSSSASANNFTYAPAAAIQQVVVLPSLVASPVTIAFAAQLGRASVAFSGLPSALAPMVTMVGNGITRTIIGAGTLDSLPVGRYTASAAIVSANGVTYAATVAQQTVDVPLNGTAATVFAYAPTPAVVDVVVSGLPSGNNANVVVSTPSGLDTALTASARITGPAGRWRLAAAATNIGGYTYTPSPTSRDTTLVSGDTARMPVQYALSTGALALAITGLPTGASATVQITGPGFFSRTVTATATLVGLTPGTYTITAASATVFGLPYVPSAATQQVLVAASLVASPVTITYALAGGRLSLRATGLPAGLVPTFTLAGSNGSTIITGTTTVSGLTPGNYTLTANNVAAGAITYAASPATVPITITLAAVAGANFAYAPVDGGGGGGGTGGFNLAVENVYLTQAAQRYDGTVSLVAGRDALLRVFVTASAANTIHPDVRVRVYDGGTLLQTVTIVAPETSVRTATAEGTLTSTWNTLIPAANVRTSMRVVADVDPTAAIAEADRTDNIWPRGGTPQLIAVTATPAFNVRFVPVVNAGLTGNITDANKDSFLATTRRIFPFSTVVADVRAPFTSSAPALQSSDGNSAWLTILSELNALRTADAAPSTTHYYGVVKVTYNSGIAGLGYVPGRAAMGWDYLPSGDGVAAHEWGHNFSRPHTPCGVSGDPNYPYTGGAIGVWGWNATTNTLVAPTLTDIMGYCSNQWISDWTWTQVMQYRQSSGIVVDHNTRGEGLLIWGRVVDGRVLLEPALRVNAIPTPIPSGASHRAELLDNQGQTLVDFPIAAERVSDITDHDERQFAVVVPWTARLEQSLARVRVRDVRSPLASAMRSTIDGSPAAVLTDPSATIAADARGHTRVRWNAQAFPLVMARDAVTGEIMGFLRQSGAAFDARGRRVEYVYSDGVRSVVRRER